MFRAARESAQMSLGRLAAKLDVSAAYLSEVERGMRAPLSAARILAAADILATNPLPLLQASVSERGKVVLDVRETGEVGQRVAARLARSWCTLSDDAFAAIEGVLECTMATG